MLILSIYFPENWGILHLSIIYLDDKRGHNVMLCLRFIFKGGIIRILKREAGGRYYDPRIRLSFK
ncbi:hypothetical protein D3C73_1409310 [compost metagenome]